MSEHTAVLEARRALAAAYLMMPEAVALDLNRKVQAAFVALTRTPLPAPRCRARGGVGYRIAGEPCSEAQAKEFGALIAERDRLLNQHVAVANTPAPVVVLDEWRVVDNDGCIFDYAYLDLPEAQDTADEYDVVYPNSAPHRVMRVCLQEVSNDAL